MELDPELKFLAQAFRNCFNTKEGQKVLAHLSKSFDRQSYVKGDPHESSFREGQRSVVRHINALTEIGRTGKLPDEIRMEGDE